MTFQFPEFKVQIGFLEHTHRAVNVLPEMPHGFIELRHCLILYLVTKGSEILLGRWKDLGFNLKDINKIIYIELLDATKLKHEIERPFAEVYPYIQLPRSAPLKPGVPAELNGASIYHSSNSLNIFKLTP